jgi:hypothetical protein
MTFSQKFGNLLITKPIVAIHTWIACFEIIIQVIRQIAIMKMGLNA